MSNSFFNRNNFWKNNNRKLELELIEKYEKIRSEKNEKSSFKSRK